MEADAKMDAKQADAAEEKPHCSTVGQEAYKVILLGDSAVGKSKLVERYLMGDYDPIQVCP